MLREEALPDPNWKKFKTPKKVETAKAIKFGSRKLIAWLRMLSKLARN